MDLLKEMEELAFASRLKRLSDRLMQDVAQLYKAYEIDFESRWFPIFYLLKDGESRSIVDIAKEIGVSHPAVNQLSNEMLERGLIISEKNQKDKRKRFLRISKKGQSVITQLEILWCEISVCMNRFLGKDKKIIFRILNNLEAQLDEESIQSRVTKTLNEK
ncbi:MAG: helix-turn-helix domain-containing protein [Candidatus Caenarcaniphilales bacterium]|nr:helix-turn-helix domain-containing protein [Candidatus Caenarcaniphilales bacterium]